MFEKSLYDLIRGLRSHKGNERLYIQNSLRECRNEIRSADMDVKAIALLKLVYLEMFGHDMSWAAFHVLEVMSSAKHAQKRVGYLSAVQSFRPDTEVLMLATNMLKKDVTAVSIPTIGLPLITIPHLITPSLAMSILSDLLPRLGHSSPIIRKKTLVTLYRLALVYPEALRPAWPKMKDMLMDDNEDPSVIAATINTICELGWRRPKDFLPLAPRLFDLLVAGGNNWMAIKIIKLFATLTPLEPRLIKKLLPPLVNLIRTTPAMSLLYECISGIIQGGILDGSESHGERDDVAELCVSKLRGMIEIDGDPNLKYVALLAFNKIVISHPQLVAQHQDVILACIEDPDISIRLQALQLGSGMIMTDNLQTVVDLLVEQLREAKQPEDEIELSHTISIEPVAGPDDSDSEEASQQKPRQAKSAQALPTEYRAAMIRQILDMCSRDTYANIVDFEWYIDTLVDLVSLLPSHTGEPSLSNEIAAVVGAELQIVAVRVISARSYSVHAAHNLLLARDSLAATSGGGVSSLEVLEYAAWIVGEFARTLADPSRVLDAFLLLPKGTPRPQLICAYLQAIPKILASMFVLEQYTWNDQAQAKSSLVLSRAVQFMQNFIDHTSLEVQERAVGLAELLKLCQEAVVQHDGKANQSPAIISQVLPMLFAGQELNPVAASAQRKVPPPTNIDLAAPINDSLAALLLNADKDESIEAGLTHTRDYYYQKPEPAAVVARPAIERIPDVTSVSSYQNSMPHTSDPTIEALRRTERRERNRDDPFYIPSNQDSGRSTPLHEILSSANGQEVEIDSIPIMELVTGDTPAPSLALQTSSTKPRRTVQLVAEETFDEAPNLDNQYNNHGLGNRSAARSLKKGLLQVDSSNIGTLSLSQEQEAQDDVPLDGDAEMADALANIERLRMEMQRASERIDAPEDIAASGTLVRKKKKKKKPVEAGLDETGEALNDPPSEVVVKKKKKKKVKEVSASTDI